MWSWCAAVALLWIGPAGAQILDKQQLLERQTFWDNRDWSWYKENIPFFDCPDADLNTTYYYRWEVVTKHLTYGSPSSGYCFTEFIDRPFWSGAYGSISCPAGHQLYEVRWLKDPRFARDYGRYWLRTPGAQPRRYSTWLADALWAVHQVHPDEAGLKGLFPDLVANYEGWEKGRFVHEIGLFWQTGHDDGMEYNINSRQTKDLLRGAPAYRPTLNSYLWADALAIARVADLAGDRQTAARFRARAAGIKENLKKLWDPKRAFYFPMEKQDEEKDGNVVKALSLTYQTGKYAGNPHGRELIGYVPWQFNLPEPGKESAWKFLMDRDYFFADYGPTTVERRDPLFYLTKTCCYWSGQSWPYATTQTLKALANLLQNYRQEHVTTEDYYKLFRVYARTHRKAGTPYIAEAAHPDTGSWDGHDSFNHSEHYFHSGYVDLIITGLVGLRPRDDDVLEVQSLAPAAWDYFALDDIAYRGQRVSIVWDKEGTRYGLGKGLHLLVNGKKLATAPHLERLTATLPKASPQPALPGRLVNLAVNNDGLNFPKVTASFNNPQTPLGKLVDGNYWYHRSPPNRWTCAGSSREADWVAIDFGARRKVHLVKLYILDDGEAITAPERIDLEYWDGKAWLRVPDQQGFPGKPAGHRANVIRFPPREMEKVRAVFVHSQGGRTGLTEFEVWGDAEAATSQTAKP
jgi:hypothetical protein